MSQNIAVTELVPGRGNNNTQVVFRNCALFTDCITEINNTQIDNAKGIHIVMLMYNLIKYSDNFKNIRKFLAILWR